jgi:hypothetical protein
MQDGLKPDFQGRIPAAKLPAMEAACMMAVEEVAFSSPV